MSVTLKHEDLAKALTLVKNNPKDEQIKIDFIEVVKPIIKLTVSKFPAHLADDMAQEMKMFLMKRADYISVSFFSGKIKNPTNYLFRVCYNAGMNYFKKELKYTSHLVPIDDIKIEPAYTPKTYKKQQILDKIRDQMMDFINTRFLTKEDRTRAQKFLMTMMEGKRPSFETAKLIKFANARQQTAKDIYSIILLKLREITTRYYEELTE